MTSGLLFGLLAAIVGAALVWLVSGDSGYIIISIGSYSLEMSFWFGVLLVVLAAYMAWKLYKLFVWCRDALAGSVSWISESRSKRIERRTNKGLIYFIEGNWRAAKKELLAAAKLEKTPLLQYLAAANSAVELGEKEETFFLLKQAEKLTSENELAILVTKARIEIMGKDYEQALLTLENAIAIYPEDVVLLKLLKIVNLRLQAWTSVLTLLPKLKAKKIYDKEELLALELEAWKGQLTIALNKAVELNTSPAASFENIWKEVPSDIRKDTSIVALYVDKLLQTGFQERALDTLIAALKYRWDAPLLLRYGNIDSSDNKQHLSRAESWLREHPTDPDLLFVLGKIARANQLWGKAKEYLEKSLVLKPVAHSYAELGSLLAHLGEHKESVECYRKGLALIPS